MMIQKKMEEHKGIVILATNFQKNMDKAFLRRLHFVVNFPKPEEEDRYRIWQSVWPDQIPMTKDIDFKKMAKDFEITGGEIKNIAVGAAFLAADKERVVDMNHIIRSTIREYKKMGKVIVDSFFDNVIKEDNNLFKNFC